MIGSTFSEASYKKKDILNKRLKKLFSDPKADCANVCFLKCTSVINLLTINIILYNIPVGID